MSAPVTPVEAQRVACEVCLKEIPRSEAGIAEAVDYVAYFCGLECYEQWKKNRRDVRSAAAKGQGAGEP